MEGNYQKKFLAVCSAFILVLAYGVTEKSPDPKIVPKFSDKIPNITRTVGRDALLTCNVEQLKGFKVAWVQVDTQTILTIHKQVITRNPRISLLHDDHRSWHLQIKNLQESDRGWYMCQVNTDPMRYEQGYLDVVVPPDIIDKESSGDMIVNEGEDVELQCKAKGHPEPSIIWRREDNEHIVLEGEKKGGGNDNDASSVFTHVDDSQSVKKVEGETLTMRKVSRLQMGSYLCIASNNVPPSISKRIHLKIHFPPVAWVPQQLEGAYVGQELTMECHTEAFPLSINYWTNSKDEMIVTGDRMESTLARHTYKTYMKLRIKHVIESDFGTFRCMARNSLGVTDGAIRVYEMEPPPTYKPKTIDYEKETDSEEDNSSLLVTTRPYNKKERKKQDGMRRKGPNDIIDTQQMAKDRNEGRKHDKSHPKNYLFGVDSSSAGLSNHHWLLNALLLVAIVKRTISGI